MMRQLRHITARAGFLGVAVDREDDHVVPFHQERPKIEDERFAVAFGWRLCDARLLTVHEDFRPLARGNCGESILRLSVKRELFAEDDLMSNDRGNPRIELF